MHRHRLLRPAARALDRHARDVRRRHRHGLARRAPRWSTSRCSGGTPMTSPIRRRGSACRSIRTRCSARRNRRAWSIRRARSSSISSRTIRWPSGPTRCNSRRWRSRCTPARRATTADISPASINCDADEVDAYTTYGKTFRQLGPRLSQDAGRNRGHVALPARRHRRRHRDDALVGARALRRRRRRRTQQRPDRACDLSTARSWLTASSLTSPACSRASVPRARSRPSARRLDGLRDSPGRSRAGRRSRRRSATSCGTRPASRRTRAAFDPRSMTSSQIRIDLLPDMRLSNARTERELRMARCDRRRQHARCLRADRSFLARAQGKPRARSCARDFPDTDNANWLAANIMSKSGNGFRFEQRALRAAVFRARTSQRKDNLEVAW